MAPPINLANAPTAEQQAYMILEHIADLQRDPATNANDVTVLNASSHDDIAGIYSFNGQLNFSSTADELAGTMTFSADEVLVAPV